jgi:hypothetical protein
MFTRMGWSWVGWGLECKAKVESVSSWSVTITVVTCWPHWRGRWRRAEATCDLTADRFSVYTIERTASFCNFHETKTNFFSNGIKLST